MNERLYGLDFGETVHTLRMAAGFTQRELADVLGVSFTYISKIENGRLEKMPSEKLIRKLADLLGGDAEHLCALAGKFDFYGLQLEAITDPFVVGRLIRRLAAGDFTDREKRLFRNLLAELERQS